MAEKRDTTAAIDATFDDLANAIAPRANPVHRSDEGDVVLAPEIVAYTDPERHDPMLFRLDLGTQPIWATQSQIASLFDTDISGVSRHLNGILKTANWTQITMCKICKLLVQPRQ